MLNSYLVMADDSAPAHLQPSQNHGEKLRDRIGVVTHIFAKPLPEQELILSIVQELGVGFIREDFLWTEIEKTAGVFDFTKFQGVLDNLNNYGLKILPLICYGNPQVYEGYHSGQYSPPKNIDEFAGYMSAVQRATEPFSIGYEVWNEPNIPERFMKGLSFKESAEYFAKLMNFSVKILNDFEPEKAVVSGGLFAQQIGQTVFGVHLGTRSGFEFLQMMPVDKSGKTNGSLNHLGWHPYTYPPQSFASEQSIAGLRKEYETLHQYSNNIWITEMGFHTAKFSPWPSVGLSETRQGIYLIRNIALHLAMNAKKYVIYQLVDNGAHNLFWPENAFGLLKYDLSKKLSFEMLSYFLNTFSNAEQVRLQSLDQGKNIRVSFYDRQQQWQGDLVWPKDENTEVAEIKVGHESCLFNAIGTKFSDIDFVIKLREIDAQAQDSDPIEAELVDQSLFYVLPCRG